MQWKLYKVIRFKFYSLNRFILYLVLGSEYLKPEFILSICVWEVWIIVYWVETVSPEGFVNQLKTLGLAHQTYITKLYLNLSFSPQIFCQYFLKISWVSELELLVSLRLHPGGRDWPCCHSSESLVLQPGEREGGRRGGTESCLQLVLRRQCGWLF